MQLAEAEGIANRVHKGNAAATPWNDVRFLHETVASAGTVSVAPWAHIPDDDRVGCAVQVEKHPPVPHAQAEAAQGRPQTGQASVPSLRQAHYGPVQTGDHLSIQPAHASLSLFRPDHAQLHRPNRRHSSGSEITRPAATSASAAASASRSSGDRSSLSSGASRNARITGSSTDGSSLCSIRVATSRSRSGSKSTRRCSADRSAVAVIARLRASFTRRGTAVGQCVASRLHRSRETIESLHQLALIRHPLCLILADSASAHALGVERPDRSPATGTSARPQRLSHQSSDAILGRAQVPITWLSRLCQCPPSSAGTH